MENCVTNAKHIFTRLIPLGGAIAGITLFALLFGNDNGLTTTIVAMIGAVTGGACGLYIEYYLYWR